MAGEDIKSNISKILCYAAIQNFIFVALQQAVFAAIGEEDEEEATDSMLNSMLDTILGGLGIYGQVLVTFKNGILEYIEQEEKGFNADHAYTLITFLNVSPTIGSKIRTLYSGIKTRQINKDVIESGEFSILDPQNPEFQALADVIQAFTNIPTSRITRKVNNIIASSDSEIEVWEKTCLLLGWNTWDLGVETEAQYIRRKLKEKKEKKKEKEKEIRDKENLEELLKPVVEKEIEEYEEDLENGDIEFDGDGFPTNKVYYCPNVNKSKRRCGAVVEKPGVKCTYHEDVVMGNENKRCSFIKYNKAQCGNMTKAISGLCAVHD